MPRDTGKQCVLVSLITFQPYELWKINLLWPCVTIIHSKSVPKSSMWGASTASQTKVVSSSSQTSSAIWSFSKVCSRSVSQVLSRPGLQHQPAHLNSAVSMVRAPCLTTRRLVLLPRRLSLIKLLLCRSNQQVSSWALRKLSLKWRLCLRKTYWSLISYRLWYRNGIKRRGSQGPQSLTYQMSCHASGSRILMRLLIVS